MTVLAGWDVGIHEAGHTIADLILGAGVAEVRVDGVMGRYQPRGPTSAVACMCGFAGPVPPAGPSSWVRQRVRRGVARLISDGFLSHGTERPLGA